MITIKDRVKASIVSEQEKYTTKGNGKNTTLKLRQKKEDSKKQTYDKHQGKIY
jgi:ribosomal protein L33